ncbi:hypothetical protein CN563_13270 [Bacillus sp. AFS026049]|nr:hypothetical protein CN563_13270 [Bacillus sp. AFS026049]
MGNFSLELIPRKTWQQLMVLRWRSIGEVYPGYTQDSFFPFFIQKVQKEGTKHCVEPYYKKVVTWNVSSHEEEKCK